MRWSSTLVLVLGLAAACGAPSQSTTNAVAGGAALVAGAATLADPNGAAKKQENKGGGAVDNRGKKVNETVPPDVLDRLDAAEGKDQKSVQDPER
jgi:hypothetical protein